MKRKARQGAPNFIGGTLNANAFVIGAAAILFATLQGAPVPSAGDFTMI